MQSPRDVPQRVRKSHSYEPAKISSRRFPWAAPTRVGADRGIAGLQRYARPTPFFPEAGVTKAREPGQHHIAQVAGSGTAGPAAVMTTNPVCVVNLPGENIERSLRAV